MADLTGLRVPTALREDVAQVVDLTDGFCGEHLDEEYAALCRDLVARLARKRPSPLARGDLRVWAAAVLHVVASANFLFDRASALHLSRDDLAARTGVPKSTASNKAGAIKNTLGLGPHDTELCHRDVLARHPYAWYVEIDGLIIDARGLPPPLLAEAQRRGLVPHLA